MLLIGDAAALLGTISAGVVIGIVVLAVGMQIVWRVRPRIRCPECAEPIRPEAHVCRHCGSRLVPS